MKITIRRAALEDLRNICDFLDTTSDSAATRFLDAVDDELSLLAVHPFLGRKRHFKTKGIRSWRIRRFENFLMFYAVHTKSIEVIRILHGAREVRKLL